jgi:short-subunit dehydrogenase
MARKLALVTGASSGLGAEYARIAARADHDLVLVARRLPQLESLAAELKTGRGIEATPLAFDLGKPGAPEALFEHLRGRAMQPDVLVNNAGFGDTGPFLDLQLSRQSAMLDLNCRALVELSWLFGRGMRQRRSGRILNVASTAGFQPGPYMATYYATKSFVISFSQALGYELRGSGVTVTAHCPGATATEFATSAGNEKSRLFRQRKPASASQVALHGWRAMQAGRALAVHGALNRVVAFSVRLSPRGVVNAIAARLNQPD